MVLFFVFCRSWYLVVERWFELLIYLDGKEMEKPMSLFWYSMMMMMMIMFVCEKEVLCSLRAGDFDVECEEERYRRVCPVRPRRGRG